MTYGEVARRAGNPKAARAVGTIMKNNFNPAIPCHRVILSSGGVGAYNRGGERAKRELLNSEGGWRCEIILFILYLVMLRCIHE